MYWSNAGILTQSCVELSIQAQDDVKEIPTLSEQLSDTTSHMAHEYRIEPYHILFHFFFLR